jgi:preprotein translocase subunit SecF
MFSGLTFVIALVFIFTGNINWGIDFTGGSKLELQRVSDMSAEQIIAKIGEFDKANENADLGSITYQESTINNALVIKMRYIDNDIKNNMLSFINDNAQKNVKELSYLTIGPVVGENLKNNATKALVLAIIGMILFIAFSFREVPKHISPWKFGVVAIVALLHDVIIMIGTFTILGRYLFGIEIDIFFVTAVLTILGYSVNDTIVVFDRFRENLIKMKKGDKITDIADHSINSTLARSFNTSLTVFFVLLAFLFIGPASIKFFILALTIGVAFGTYSSICVALPLLVKWQKA